MPEPIEVRKVPILNVSDASGLAALIDDGVMQADRVIAVIGKTEGNGGVNDYTRIIADRAFREVLVEKGNRSAEEVKQVPIVWSGGTDGIISPHATVFATLPRDKAEQTDDPRLTVRQAVAEPLALHTPLDAAGRRAKVADVLAQVGLGAELAERYPHELSGGQRQRVNIARAIATGPRLVVLDEPTSALDVSLRARIILLLDALRARLGMTYLFISHDLATVKYLAHRVAVMYLGTVVEQAPTRELFAHPLHPYTRALLSAVPVPDPEVRRERLRLAGEVPSPIDVPAGCRLRSRCPLAQAVCAEPVPLREVAPGHAVACHLV